ncbi:MAG: hypothetical protein QM713_01885 [Arachnia sp.]
MSAELLKLGTLPAVWATAVGTVAAGGILGAAVASHPGVTEISEALAPTVGFLQVGTILLGILAVASEYSGRQIATTLVAVPRRPVLLAGKAAAGLLATTATAILTVATAALAAGIVLARRGVAVSPDGGRLAGMVAYLALIGLFALCATVLLRGLVASLVVLESLVLIVSPLLTTITEHARWLPDRAGSRLYLPPAADAWDWQTGGAVLLAWVITAATLSAVVFHARDA